MNQTMMGRLGWAAAAALGAVLLVGGFQAQSEKTGVVDMNKVITDSKLGARNQNTIRSMVASRQALLTFVDSTRILTAEQAQKLKAYATKDTALTDVEKRDEEKIKADVQTAVKNFNQLNQKPNPTEDDRRLLSEYNQRIEDTVKQLKAWQDEFTEGLQAKGAEFRALEIAKAKEALTEVSKKGGFSVVLENQIAPFGANDLTADAIKAMDAKNP